MFKMNYLRFLLFNFSGAVTWATTFGCLGFVFGSNWQSLTRLLARIDRIVLLIAAAAVAAAVIYRRRKK